MLARERSIRPALVLLSVLTVLCALASAPVQAAGNEVELLSGVGYTSKEANGPSLLLGAELTAYERQGSLFTGINEARVGLHASDEIAVDGSPGTLTLGLEGEWIRTQGPTSLIFFGKVLTRHRGDEAARTLSLGGGGAAGRVSGQVRVDYVESSLSTFPWFQRDLDVVVAEEPFYRISAGVSAAVLPDYGLKWSQDLRWRRGVDSSVSRLGLTTGPEMLLGPGNLAVQGGLLFAPQGIKPLAQVRYLIRPNVAGFEFELTAATHSLDKDGPVLYGWFGVDGEDLGIGAALRLEEGSQGGVAPAVYFSLHPKF